MNSAAGVLINENQNENENENVQVKAYDYLTLGDGDFTYSLDLCRYLQVRASLSRHLLPLLHDNNTNNGGDDKDKDMSNNQTSHDHDYNHNDNVGDISVICTGIDSLDELQKKYHDAKFTLKKIASLHGPVQAKLQLQTQAQLPLLVGQCNSNKRKRLAIAPVPIPVPIPIPAINISVHHCVNAIHSSSFGHDQIQEQVQEQEQGHDDNDNDNDNNLQLQALQPEPAPALPMNCRFRQVIFNHPHVGSEDALRHSRFLAHFFHSCNHTWLAYPDRALLGSSSKTLGSSGTSGTTKSESNLASPSASAGVVHLTLVMGQFDRWKCVEMAAKHGLVVLNRCAFRPPPPPGKYMDCIIRQGGIGLEQQKGKDHRSNDETISSSTSTSTNENGKKSDKITTNSLSLPDSRIIFQTKKDDYKSRYQYRRHQSGRSFASRRAQGGSETITLGRKDDAGFYSALELPWQSMKFEFDEGGSGSGGNNKNNGGNDNGNHNDNGGQSQTDQSKFKCPHCDKSFRDERARKNHIKCVHQNSKNNNNSNQKSSQQQQQQQQSSATTCKGAPPSLNCDLCKKEGLFSSRVFPHMEALEAHKKAKHTGICTIIRPDWASKNKKDVKNGHGSTCTALNDTTINHDSQNGDDNNQSTSTSTGTTNVKTLDFGSCIICDMRFESEEEKMQHYRDFIPTNVSNSKRVLFQCTQCGKTFRDKRAQLQHRNFCSVMNNVTTCTSKDSNMVID